MPSRAAILAFVAAIHIAILLMALQRMTRLRVVSEESRVFLLPPGRTSPPAATAQHTEARDRSVARHDTQRLLSPPPPVAVDRPPASVDWAAEAEAAAKHQADLAATKPRASDQHGAGTDFNGGLGSDRERPAEFGWDHSHTHRIETLTGGGMLVWLNDRCVIILFPLPFGGCGIGTIPVRGDLFGHMRDAQKSDSGSLNRAP
jgi:hypothetical protein